MNERRAGLKIENNRRGGGVKTLTYTALFNSQELVPLMIKRVCVNISPL